MAKLDVPANVTIMRLTPERLAALKPVRVLDIYDGNTNNFHEDGLFSTSIFGRVGSDERDQRFSYIDLRVPVLHPLIYKHIVKLKGLYAGIMTGKAFAVWDPKEKDFFPSDQVNGQTGYDFFMKHWKQIDFKPTGSDVRDMRIQLIAKYKSAAETDKVLVIPAGLRDIQITEDGRTKEGEINSAYRSLIAISNSVSTNIHGDLSVLNTSRTSMQNAFNLVYQTLENLIEGKHGFIMHKWGARSVFNGTRNVISSMDTSAPNLDADNFPKTNQTAIGIYQLSKGALPKTKFWLMNGWLKHVFGTPEAGAWLVNPVTLKKENVKVGVDIFDRWYTTNGLEKVINQLQEPSLRLKPIMINDYYLGLIYRPKNKLVFKIFGDIEEMPQDESFSKDDVHPLSLCELVYLSGYQHWNKLGCYVTRYPVTGLGSIYPSHPYVKTTIRGESRMELGEDWQPLGKDHVALECPTFDKPVFVETLVPHPSRIKGMGADFDGDTASCTVVYTDEAVEEIQRRLSSRAAYVTPEGGLTASPVYETVERVMRAMTGP